jgi:nicotinate-nucleotide adenylyltransferase
VARVGILGGAFNPPHLGHLVCASEAAWQLRLDRVLLTPVAVAPHKRTDSDPGAGDERLGVCDLEVVRGGTSYTVDTLRELHEREPEDHLTFILGGDAALGLPDWHEPEAVLGLATLAVAERSGAAREDVEQRLQAAFPGLGSLEFFAMPRIDISSSDVRSRVAEGRPIRYLVPDGVADRIEQGGLYR